MTKFLVTIIDEHDCDSTCGQFYMDAVDKADAALQLHCLYGDGSDYLQIQDWIPADDI